MTVELSVDVCVIGTGASGIAAASAAARAGASVIAVERYGFLGGIGTGAMLGVFCGLYTSGREPRPVATGVGWTVVERLLEVGATFRSRFGRTYLVHYDAERLKSVYDSLFRELGVKVFLHALCSAAYVRDWQVLAVDIHTRSDVRRIRARVFVDCSGDADLCYRAGVPTQVGDENGRTQPGTAVFRMCGVDSAQTLQLSREEMNAQMRDDAQSGRFALPRTSGSFYPTTNPGEVVVNMTRVAGLRAVDPDDLSRGESEGRRQIWLYADWLRQCVPGFAKAFVSATGAVLGVRESRRVVPRRWLTADDLRHGVRVDDELGVGAWPFEVHEPVGLTTRLEWLPDDTTYSIPLSAAMSPALDNLLVVGRCLGASPEALASSRVMGSCFSSGEGAGAVAATAAAATGCLPSVNVPEAITRWRGLVPAVRDISWPPAPTGIRA